MILSDADIARRLDSGDLVIDPLLDPDLQIQPASVDLRLGRRFLEFQRTNIPCIHPDSEREVEEYVSETTVDEGNKFILHPGDFVLGTTKERVEIPADLIAHVEGRSSLGRLAVVVHASLPGDEPVFLWTPTEGYGWYPIGEIVESRRPARAVAFDPQTLAIDTYRVTDYITNPRKRIYRVELASGRAVHVTKDHNLFTIAPDGGVVRIPSESAEGQLVMVPEQIPDSPSAHVGALDGDGHGDWHEPGTSPRDAETLHEFGRRVGKNLADGALETRLPPPVWEWPRSACRGLWAGFGSKAAPIVETRDLAGDLVLLAARLGRRATIEPVEPDTDGPWRVSAREPGREDPIPTPTALLNSLETDGAAGPAARPDGGTNPDRLTRGELERTLDRTAAGGPARSRLEQLVSGDVAFDRVESVVETDRVEPTYDLEVQPAGRPIENFLGGRGGVFLSNTAGLCDPGYRGQITLELSNLGTAPVALTPGMRVSQLTFTELTTPADRPYGAERGSKYQDQSGPQASRIQGDHEFGGEQR